MGIDIMKLDVREKKSNPLMKREEVWVSVEHLEAPTPKRAELLEGAVKLLKTKKELVIIDKIFSERGRGGSEVKVLVYKSEKDIPKDKAEKMKRRMGKKKAAPAEAAPAEKPAEGEAKAEEKKEEAKPEEKEEEKKEEPKAEEKKEEKPAEKKEETKPEEKPAEEKKEEEKK